MAAASRGQARGARSTGARGRSGRTGPTASVPQGLAAGPRAAGMPRRSLRCRSSRSWRRGRAQATWGEWLDVFTRLAPRVLRTPAHVLRVLADLRPMADVGPIDLDEARRVLTERLLTLESEPPARRFGRRVRRHAGSRRAAAASASCSCRAWPSGCSRRSRARIRCCSTTLRVDARRVARDAAAAARGRAPAAAAGGRRRVRAALRVVSAHRAEPSRARACRRSTRST